MSGNQLLIFSILLCGMSILARWGEVLFSKYLNRKFEDCPIWLRVVVVACLLGPISMAGDGDSANLKARVSMLLILVAWGIVATHGTVKRNE